MKQIRSIANMNHVLSDHYFPTVLEMLNEPAILFDVEGNIISSSKKMVKILGFSDISELLNHKIQQFITHVQVNSNYIQLTEIDKIENAKCELNTREGSIIFYSLSCMAVRSVKDLILYYLVILNDVVENNELSFIKLWKHTHIKQLVNDMTCLNSELDYISIAKMVCKLIADSLSTSPVLFLDYSPNKEAFTLVASEGTTSRKLISRIDQISSSLKILESEKEFIAIDFAGENGTQEIFGFSVKDSEKFYGAIIIPNFVTTNDTKEIFLNIIKIIASHAAIWFSHTFLNFKYKKQLSQTKSLHIIDAAINSCMDLNVTLEIILGQIKQQLKIDTACILIYNQKYHNLRYSNGIGFYSNVLKQTYLKLGEGFAGMAALERQKIYIPDLRNHQSNFSRSPYFKSEGFVSYLAIPLIAKGELKGVLEIYQRSVLDTDKNWLDFAQSIADQAAIAIEYNSLFVNLEKSHTNLTQAYEATIEGWSRAMDLRDKETEGHTLRVTGLTLQLAQTYDFSEDELIQIRRGALLHDIGKIGVPDHILLKKGELTKSEWAIMKRHPTYAYNLLFPIDYLRPAIDIPYCHHEKWDGTGYPRGLAGEDIPISARIFAIVDVYDALINNRPYRLSWPKKKVLDYLLANSGTHFEPEVVTKFFKLLQAED